MSTDTSATRVFETSESGMDAASAALEPINDSEGYYPQSVGVIILKLLKAEMLGDWREEEARIKEETADINNVLAAGKVSPI